MFLQFLGVVAFYFLNLVDCGQVLFENLRFFLTQIFVTFQFNNAISQHQFFMLLLLHVLN
jgi:hypothetical protein